MKRLRSSEDLDAYGKDPNPNPSPSPGPNPYPSRTSSSTSHRSFYYNKPDKVVRKGLLSSSSSASSLAAAARRGDDDRDAAAGGSRMVRKRPAAEHEFEVGFERRKVVDSSSSRYGRDGGGGYDRSVVHRSESFSGGGGGSRRGSEFPKGFRSERDRPRREGSVVSSWRRFGKEFEEGRSGGGRLEERVKGCGGGGGGLRDVRSPSWSNSRDSGSEQSRVRSPPPRRFKDGKSSKSTTSKSKSPTSKSKSPTWSKDSVGSEQSKGVEVKKSEPKTEPEPVPEPEKEPEREPEREAEPELEPVLEQEAEPEAVAVVEEVQGESESRTSSEMEEGELEPEAEAEPEAGDGGGEAKAVPEAGAEMGEGRGGNEVREESFDKEDVNKEGECEGKEEEKKRDELASVDGTGNAGEDGCGGKELSREEDKERKEEVVTERELELEDETKEDNGIDLEVKAEDDEMTESDREVTEDTGVHTLNLSADLSRNFKDKGKSVAHVEDSAENSGWVERESRELLTSMDNDMEGPSTRGFELFTCSPVRRQEKADSGVNMKDEKLVLEPLDLSLSLPNILLPIGAAPGSPDQTMSVQSLSNTFCTNSDGFTQSVSFSGSQSFYHNPSCSLTTQNSMDFEQSVKSRPLFQGIDWQALAQNEAKTKEVPIYQKPLITGNGSLPHSGVTNGPSVQGQQLRHLEGSSKGANGFERQLSFHKQLSGGQPKHHEDVRSPSHCVGSHEMGSNYSFDRKRLMREKSSGSLYRSSSLMEKEKLLIGGSDFVETIIVRIVSDPVHVMAKKFHEMTGQSAACVKESIREIMLNVDKRMQLSAFQKALQNRSDITLEMLLKSHRTQLEILVALKTGLPDFLQQESSISSSDLAEIFLYLRCRNPSCRSPVPVDECDCKVCSQKSGFCSSCMCLVCSKFDMASNTCSWIGCDVCLHWCHADCALRESYIRNGRSATGSQGTEMQFHCVACDHPSEMFGFVKEVFQNFAKDWTIENLARELEYVKRIFVVSKDIRGRQLYEIADQSLVRLANKSGLSEVYSFIMAFLLDADSSKLGKMPILSGKEQGKGSSGIAGPSQEPAWLKSVYTEKAPQLESARIILASFNYDQHDKRNMESEMHNMSSQKEPVFDELESIVRLKQAEAKMFQTRVDEARKEAEGLKRIALAKNEKIEEEYRSRITKLRFIEAEEMRKHKLEELQSLDRAHREYSNMKMRMEADIKDLLLKMEATKRNLSL